MQSPALEVSKDRAQLTISFPEHPEVIEIGTAEVDALMRRLAECRSRMEPVHPAEPPPDPNLVYRNDNLLFKVSACQAFPAIEIASHHAGLGWTTTILARDQAEDMQTSIDFALQAIRHGQRQFDAG